MLKKPFSKKGNNFWEAASLEVGCRVPPPPLLLKRFRTPDLKKSVIRLANILTLAE